MRYREPPTPLHVAYAIGALTGPCTDAAFALKWEQVDLAARRIHVRESIASLLKDKDSRAVPILDGLQPVLATCKLKSDSVGAGRRAGAACTPRTHPSRSNSSAAELMQ